MPAYCVITSGMALHSGRQPGPNPAFADSRRRSVSVPPRDGGPRADHPQPQAPRVRNPRVVGDVSHDPRSIECPAGRPQSDRPTAQPGPRVGSAAADRADQPRLSPPRACLNSVTARGAARPGLSMEFGMSTATWADFAEASPAPANEGVGKRIGCRRDDFCRSARSVHRAPMEAFSCQLPTTSVPHPAWSSATWRISVTPTSPRSTPWRGSS